MLSLLILTNPLTNKEIEMNRSKQIVIASILTAVYALQAMIRASIAIATQSQFAQDAHGFIVVGLILFTVSLVSAYGVWQNQKWGKILAIITLALNALTALPGVLDAPTLQWKLEAVLAVIVFVVVTVLLLRPSQPPVTA